MTKSYHKINAGVKFEIGFRLPSAVNKAMPAPYDIRRTLHSEALSGYNQVGIRPIIPSDSLDNR